MSFQPTFSRSVDVAAFQICFISESDGMDQEIEATPPIIDFLEQGLDLSIIPDIAGQTDLPCDLLDERANSPLQAISLIGKTETRPHLVKDLADSPGDTSIIGHTENQSSTSGHAVGEGHRISFRGQGPPES